MPKRLLTSMLFSFALMSSACSAPMKTPDIKQNPHPKMRYEITITIEGAPGSFDSMQTIAQYDIENDHCVPLQPMSGARLTPDKTIEMPLTRVGDNTYRGEVYTDLLEDADYYGLGICHWKLSGVSMYLKHKKLTFPPSISLDNILAQKSEERYFSNRSFADANMERVDTGNSKRADFHQEANHTFSVVLTAKENFK